MNKILTSLFSRENLVSVEGYKILQNRFFSPPIKGRKKTKRFLRSHPTIENVLKNPNLGLGIKLNGSTIGSLSIGVYDNSNLDSFFGVIMYEPLNHLFNLQAGLVVGIAFSLGREEDGRPVILIDGYLANGKLLSGIDGDSGDNLTPTRIPKY